MSINDPNDPNQQDDTYINPSDGDDTYINPEPDDDFGFFGKL